MTHDHSLELHQKIINAALTGTSLELPECCISDVIALACEVLTDDLILGADFIE